LQIEKDAGSLVVYIVPVGMLVAKKTIQILVGSSLELYAFIVSWILMFTDSLRILIPLLAKHIPCWVILEYIYIYMGFC
jgi:hypothetical protein